MFEDRWYQKEAVDNACEMLGIGGHSQLHKGVSVLAATGAGKTYIGGRFLGRCPTTWRVLVLQHTEKLLAQNKEDITLFSGTPETDVGVWQGATRETHKRVVFAMTQTIASQGIGSLWFDLVIYDEAHHAPAPENAAILAQVRAINPACRLLALTATPVRPDRKKLSSVGVEACAYQVPVGTLIDEGTLARPRPMVMDLGVEAATRDRKGAFGMGDGDPVVEAILGTTVAKEAVLRVWEQEALGLRTLSFASSVRQAEEYAEVFAPHGARAVHSKLKASVQDDIMSGHRAGAYPLLWNVNQLTEGYDDPLVRCVLNLRNMGARSTASQVWGRGLRKPNSVRHPGVVKDECLLLDFGASLARMPDLFTAPMQTDAADKKPGQAPTKACKECGYACHLSVRECPDCGAAFPAPALQMGKILLTEVKMIPLAELKRASKLRWTELTPSVIVASTFEGAAIAHRPRPDAPFEAWYAPQGGRSVFLTQGTRDEVCSALDAYVHAHQGKVKWSATKAAPWTKRPASPKQMGFIRKMGGPGFEMTGGEAAAWITWLLHKNKLVR